jgi:methylated-DNA-[protein]-cysteine S-methyltransferase
MDAANHLLFPTPLGPCGLVWSAAGLAGIHLPERGETLARAALRRRFPGSAPAAPPAWVAALTGRIAAHLGGGKADYDDVVLDSDAVGAFEMRVYALARAIPPGETATYGALARRLGDVGLARAVGQALGRNPWPIVIPCHRVTAADGRAGGFSAPGGRTTKLKLLEIEGALAADALPLFAATAEFKQG